MQLVFLDWQVKVATVSRILKYIWKLNYKLLFLQNDIIDKLPLIKQSAIITFWLLSDALKFWVSMVWGDH